MTRPLRTIALAAVFLGGVSSSRSAAQPSRPNILFILADDLDLAEVAYMPKVKALIADQGVTFTNYFVSVSLCCPSRTTMLRGQYSHNTGVKTNGGGNGGFERAYADGVEKSTIATWLKGGGYSTALYGKYLNGYPNTAPPRYIPPGWTDWASSVGGNPYSEYNYQLNENGRVVRYGTSAADYGTDVYAKKTDAFVRKAAAERTPFFVYLAVYAPHQPATPAPRHASLYKDARAPRPPSFNEDDVSDKPAFIRSRPKLLPRAVNVIDQLYQRRLQSLQAVDDAVASLVETLKATGQLDRTFIVFASDNGFHLGQHRLQAGKQTAYEEDIRVPLIVRGPGVPAGKKVDSFAGNIDLAPTFAEMGGVTAPDFVDGRSLLSQITGGPTPAAWRQSYLIEHWQEGPSAADDSREPRDSDQIADPDQTPQRGQRGQRGQRAGRGGRAGGAAAAGVGIPEYHALRTAQYTYVEYVTGERELYDLRDDPYELKNIASTVKPELLGSLAAELTQLKACSGSRCR